MFLDKYGFPVQADGDTGDVANRVGWFWHGSDLQKNPLVIPGMITFDDAMNLLEPRKDGWLVRHPDRMDFSDFSRDQQIPIVVELGKRRKLDILKRVFIAHLKRFFVYQNGDIGFLEIGTIYIRSFRAWYLTPLLLLCDWGMVFNSLDRIGLIPSWKYETKKFVWMTPDDVDDLNHQTVLYQALTNYPNPVVWLATLIYALFRPANFGNTIKGETSHVQGALTWYFRPEAKANPEMGELYRPLVLRFFDRITIKIRDLKLRLF